MVRASPGTRAAEWKMGMWALRVLCSCRVREASSRPRREFKPRPREPFELGELEQPNGGFPCAPAPKITGSKQPGRCQGGVRPLQPTHTCLLSITSFLIV